MPEAIFVAIGAAFPVASIIGVATGWIAWLFQMMRRRRRIAVRLAFGFGGLRPRGEGPRFLSPAPLR